MINLSILDFLVLAYAEFPFLEALSDSQVFNIFKLVFLQISHRQRGREEGRNCKWFSELLWVKGSDARTIPSVSWCGGDSGFVSSEDVLR